IDRYLELTRGIVRLRGAELFAGPSLDAMLDPPSLRRVASDVVTVALPEREAAAIFGMNLSVLESRGEIEPQVDLAEGLATLSAAGSPRVVTWRLRQMAFLREL
ncbi:MAG: hypothetical protein QOE25_323, partial [Actinomycetota bacterium]|nr:hypothetical protein [Actinomycetota bacterium]